MGACGSREQRVESDGRDESKDVATKQTESGTADSGSSSVETYSAHVPCSKVAISHVIGRGGTTLKQLEETTGCRFSIQDSADSDEAVVTISGPTQEAVDAGEKEVLQIKAKQANPDYAGPEGRRLRAEAEEQAQERSRLHTEADGHFAAGRKDEGHVAMKKAKAAGEAMKEANSKAAAVIMEYRNEGRGLEYLDLHGLLVAEAEHYCATRLKLLQSMAASEGHKEPIVLEIVTGAGHHSDPKRAKAPIKAAILRLVASQGLQAEECSAGSLSVTVR